jgi:pimeloyl-ACP methyl ester carboxylesterase
MPTATIDGTELAYEVIGNRGDPWVVTPGGRFSKDTPGVRELAEALAGGGGRVLIWDRPNTGASSVCFAGATESDMQADHLAGLLRHLDMVPATIVGGSGGARVSLLTAANHPDVAARLVILWITGGVYGLMNLGVGYCAGSIRAAWRGGMEAVAQLPEWAEVLERNPANWTVTTSSPPWSGGCALTAPPATVLCQASPTTGSVSFASRRSYFGAASAILSTHARPVSGCTS